MSGEKKRQALLITDFSTAPGLDWFVVNDNVMGGRSRGSFHLEEGRLVFSGSTNTDGGGFASIRTRGQLPSLDNCAAIILHALGDGRRYVLRLENADGVAYWADFEPETASLQPVRVALDAFRPRFRGRWLSGPALSAGAVTALGIMCFDGRDGPFSLTLSRIEAERAVAA